MLKNYHPLIRRKFSDIRDLAEAEVKTRTRLQQLICANSFFPGITASLLWINVLSGSLVFCFTQPLQNKRKSFSCIECACEFVTVAVRAKAGYRSYNVTNPNKYWNQPGKLESKKKIWFNQLSWLIDVVRNKEEVKMPSESRSKSRRPKAEKEKRDRSPSSSKRSSSKVCDQIWENECQKWLRLFYLSISILMKFQ